MKMQEAVNEGINQLETFVISNLDEGPVRLYSTLKLTLIHTCTMNSRNVAIKNQNVSGKVQLHH